MAHMQPRFGYNKNLCIKIVIVCIVKRFEQVIDMKNRYVKIYYYYLQSQPLLSLLLTLYQLHLRSVESVFINSINLQKGR